MVYRSRIGGWGEFSKGFADSFAAMLKLAEDKRHNMALEAYYSRLQTEKEFEFRHSPDYLAGQAGSAARAGFHEGDTGTYGGDGATSKNLAANQTEMYNAARAEGLSDSAARALVANTSGEALSDPGNVHEDGGHMAHGIVQWDDVRAAAIQRQFGQSPEKMSVTDQTKAAIWEMKNNPAYRSSWDALNSDSSVQDKIRTLVTNYERPGNPDKSIAQRLAFAGRLPTTFKGEPDTTTVATKPSKTAPGTAKGDTAGKPPETATEAKTTGKTAQADTGDGSYQVAGLNDIALTPEQAAKSRRDLEAHRANQIPPNPVISQTPEASDRPPSPGDSAPIGAIPPGPTVPAQDTAFRPPFESGYPDSAQTIPVEPPMTTQQGPESPYMPPDARGATLSPSDQPSSGVATSVHDSRQGPPQRTGAPPNVGPTPSSAPPPVMGPPQRTGAPPNVGITPSSAQGPPETRNMPVPPVGAGGEYRNMPFVGETASGSQRDPKGVYGPKPDKAAPADKSADVPSKDAQPESAAKPAIAPTPRVNQPGGLPAGVIRYEVPNSSASRAPIYTAANFSSLWGPNPPLSQRGQAAASSPPVAAASSPPSRQDDYSDVASMPPSSDYALGEQITASAKGGPIQKFSRGGIPAKPTMKFADAGTVAFTPQGFQGSRNAGMQYYFSPQYVGPQSGGAWKGTPYGQLAPNQQAWADTQKGLWSQINQGGAQDYAYWSGGGRSPSGPVDTSQYMNQFTVMPNAVWPTAAPAAPTPIAQPAPTSTTITAATPDLSADPSVTTGVGAPKIPTKGVQAKSYDPNVDAKTGAGFSNTASTGGTNYSVGSDDTLKQNDQGQIAGFQRGGAIPRRPTMKLQGGGNPGGGFSAQNQSAPPTQYTGQVPYSTWNSPTSTTYVPPGSQPSMGIYAKSMAVPNPNPAYSGYQAWGFTGPQGMSYSTGTPEQQAWYSQQMANSRATGNQWYYNPASRPADAAPAAPAPAAPAPAAPAPVAPAASTITAATPAADPNNQPGAGAPGLPNTPTVNPAIDTPAAPIVDPTTTSYTNTPDNPVPKQAKSYDPTADTTGKNSKSSSASNVGGADYSYDPTRDTNFGGRDYGQIQGFDDGGGVSPSALGMPPGLGGGQQSPPPIYYNGATYSPAGAPVGKGVTQSSVPTYIAGAIPSLPMVMGGVVRRYAEGGSVDGNEYAYTEGPGMEAGQQEWGGAAAGTPDTGGASLASYGSPQDVHPDLPAWTPQVSDGQGNPSRGLIGAISGGLHYLASQLGMDGSGQQGAIAGDANTQANRRNFVQGNGVPGAPMPTHEEVGQLHQAIGVGGGALHEGLANLAGMEATRNFWLIRGDPQKADMMAASMLQYSVSLSRDYGDQAVQRYYKNDLNGAVHAMNNAKEAIADGTMMHATVNPDGQSVNIEGSNLRGEKLWARTVGPEAILGAALHARDGSLAWHMYEIQAAKYDPQTRAIIEGRNQRRQQEAADTEISKMGPASTPYTGGPGEGDQPIPIGAPTPAPRPPMMPLEGPLAEGQGAIPGPPKIGALTPPTPSIGQSGLEASHAQPSPEQQVVMDGNRGRSPDSSGTAATAAPPQTADSGQPQLEQNQQQQTAPPTPPAIPRSAAEAAAALNPKPAPTLGVGPTREAAASPDVASPDSQEVAALTPQAEQARYQQIEQTVHAKYRDPQTGGIVLDGRLYQQPAPMDRATYPKMEKTVRDAWNERDRIYREASAEAGRRAASEIDAQRRDYGQSLASQRANATMTHQEQLQTARMREQEKLIRIREGAAQGAAKDQLRYKAQLDDYADLLARSRPRTAQDIEATLAHEHPMVTLARNMFDTPEAQALTGNDDKAGATATALIANSGYSASEIHNLGQAYHDGLRLSPGTDPNDVAEAVGLLGRGVTGFGKIDPRTGDTNILAYRADGTTIHLTLSSAVANNLKMMGDRRVGATLKTAVNESGMFAPAMPSGPTHTRAPAPTATPAPRPATPDFWSGGRQSTQPGPSLKLPERVPIEAMPEEQRKLYPELNQ